MRDVAQAVIIAEKLMRLNHLNILQNDYKALWFNSIEPYFSLMEIAPTGHNHKYRNPKSKMPLTNFSPKCHELIFSIFYGIIFIYKKGEFLIWEVLVIVINNL